MSAFTSLAQFHFDPLSSLYINLYPYRFYLSDDRTGEYVDVPAGFKSNGASIPKIARRLFGWKPMDVRWAQAAFLHDGLVKETGIQLPVINPTTGTSRVPDWNEAATWFDAALRVKRENSPNCPKLNRVLFVKAVKVWGIVR
jgi:hypothetical protein